MPRLSADLAQLRSCSSERTGPGIEDTGRTVDATCRRVTVSRKDSGRTNSPQRWVTASYVRVIQLYFVFNTQLYVGTYAYTLVLHSTSTFTLN